MPSTANANLINTSIMSSAIMSSPVAPSATASANTTTSDPPAAALVASSSSSSLVADDESSDNGNAGKKPAWNKPSNGAVEAGPVMGAVSWPALSESARASGKPTQDASKGLSDGSSSVASPQGTGSASLSLQKQGRTNANPTSTPNPTMPARQRSIKRNAGNSSSNSGASQPTGSLPQTGEVHLNNPSPRDHAQRNSQSRGGNDHPQQRNSFRRNGGLHSRDVSHHHNYGSRRDQDRSNQDWNAHQSFNGRDAYMQPQRVVPRFMRHPPPPPPPPPTTTFIGPQPVRAFGNPIGYHELAHPMYYVAGPPPDPLRAMPFVAPMSPYAMYFPGPDHQLQSKIVNQIDYYFSNGNLIRDTFLRQNMDDQGWVPIKLIAGFNKVSQLTDNIQLILDSIRSSSVVEVQGDKVRRRNDWMRWVMPPSVQFPTVPVASLGQANHDVLAAHVQRISLEENASGRSQAYMHNEAFLGRSSSGGLISQSQVSSADGRGQVGLQEISDSSASARNASK